MNCDKTEIITAFEKCFIKCDKFKCITCYQDGPGFGYECRQQLCRDVFNLLIAPQEKSNNWIKTTEKFPLCGTDVIVCIKDENGDNPYYYTTVGWYLEKGQCWIVDNEVRYDVIAWQPLPEPCYGK